MRAHTPEFRGPPWCRLRPPRVDVAALARQGHGALLEAAERAGKFSWTDGGHNETDGGYWESSAVSSAARHGHAVLVHQLLDRLPSDTLYDQAIRYAALGGHASLFFGLVEQLLAKLPAIKAIKHTKRTELYAKGLWYAAKGRHWSLSYQLVALVDLKQCKLRGDDICVINWAVNSGNVEVYSYLSKKLDCVPNDCYRAVYSGSVDMLEAVIADGHATLENARSWASLSPNIAMFDAIGVSPNELDWCFVQSRTAALASALLARGAKIPANLSDDALLGQCDEWWYCEIVLASYLESLPDRAGALERIASRLVAEASSEPCHAFNGRILANLVRLGAAPRSLRCRCRL